MLEDDVDYRIEILRYRQSEKHKGEKAIFAVLHSTSKYFNQVLKSFRNM
jgi:hypothetical protein